MKNVELALDKELVESIGRTLDSYKDASQAINELIAWHIDVALDPAVNGGYRLIKVQED